MTKGEKGMLANSFEKHLMSWKPELEKGKGSFVSFLQND